MVCRMSSSHYGDRGCILATGSLDEADVSERHLWDDVWIAPCSKLSGQTLSWMPRGERVGGCAHASYRAVCTHLTSPASHSTVNSIGLAYFTFTFLASTMIRLSFFSGAARNRIDTLCRYCLSWRFLPIQMDGRIGVNQTFCIWHCLGVFKDSAKTLVHHCRVPSLVERKKR